MTDATAAGPAAASRRAALVLVATPIGNLGDLSDRARQELAGADVVACEDTRRTGRLLQLAGLRAASLVRVDEHTERGRAPALVERVRRGERVVLVTDAGSPGISDPGERVVAAAVEAGVAVVVVPGPAAAITALTGSGLPAARFCFEGFLPRGGPPRRARIEALADEERTTVLYESPHRLAATLGDLAAVVGADRRVVIARELTKLHEEWWRGTVADATGWASAAPVRGEVVIVLDGAPPPAPPGPDELAAAVHAELDAGRSVRDLSASLARRFGVPRKQVYGLAVAWTAESGQRRPPR